LEKLFKLKIHNKNMLPKKEVNQKSPKTPISKTVKKEYPIIHNSSPIALQNKTPKPQPLFQNHKKPFLKKQIQNLKKQIQKKQLHSLKKTPHKIK